MIITLGTLYDKKEIFSEFIKFHVTNPNEQSSIIYGHFKSV